MKYFIKGSGCKLPKTSLCPPENDSKKWMIPNFKENEHSGVRGRAEMRQ